MKETKYRAWYIKEKKIYPVSAIYFKAEVSVNGINPPSILQDIDMVEVFTSDDSVILDRKEVILMQFINRKDRNRKDIYEEDILKDNSGQVFIQGLCGAKRIVKEPTNATTDFKWEEVIGNIYQNKNLIT